MDVVPLPLPLSLGLLVVDGARAGDQEDVIVPVVGFELLGTFKALWEADSVTDTLALAERLLETEGDRDCVLLPFPL